MNIEQDLMVKIISSLTDKVEALEARQIELVTIIGDSNVHLQGQFDKLTEYLKGQQDRVDRLDLMLQHAGRDFDGLESKVKALEDQVSLDFDAMEARIRESEADIQQIKWNLPKPDTMARAHATELSPITFGGQLFQETFSLEPKE